MIAIIDYNAGNLKSVANAFKEIGESVIVTDNRDEIENSDAIVVPGVGAFGACINSLREKDLIVVLEDQVLGSKKPYLGICLGMQFLARTSFEIGEHRGLGWINGEVRLIEPCKKEFRVPHIGWNNIEIVKESILFEGISEDSCFYFLHSYNFYCEYEDYISSICYHGEDITASVECENIFGVQFHPEKSQKNGLDILRNFVKII